MFLSFRKEPIEVADTYSGDDYDTDEGGKSWDVPDDSTSWPDTSSDDDE